MTKARFKDLLKGNPYIKKTLSFTEHLSEVRRELEAENYDHVIDLHKNWRSFQVKRWLKKPSSSFPKLNILKWLYVNFKVNKLPDLHIVDRYFQAFHLIQNDDQGLDFYIEPQDEVELGITDYVCIVLGATYYTKRIPKEVLQQIISKTDETLVLIGGPDEKDLGEKLAGQYHHVVNTCGEYSIHESASIVKNCRKVVTSDTGMMHIASALKKEIVMVWGNTVQEFGMGPYHTKAHHFEVKGLGCRPCSKLGKAACPKGHFKCMLAQDVEGIVEHIND